MSKEEVAANSLGRKEYVLDTFSVFVPSASPFLMCSFSSVTFLEILPHCHMVLLVDESLKIIQPCCFQTVWVLRFLAVPVGHMWTSGQWCYAHSLILLTEA